jgi:glycosyltransferase involved in cell wall biosynthesis
MNKLDKKRVLVIIPAYNEGEIIEEVISNVISNGYSVAVVDDGSKDDTFGRIAKKSNFALKHIVNLGQGAALQTGFEFGLKKTACDFFVSFDADGQHRVEDIESMVEPILNDQADVVLGSRFLGFDPENIPRSRRLFLKIATLLTRVVSRIEVTDTHNGFRAFSRQALSQIELVHNDMSHASEILSIIHDKKLRFVEVPVKIIYSDYSLAKGQPLLNGINILWDMFFDEVKK